MYKKIILLLSLLCSFTVSAEEVNFNKDAVDVVLKKYKIEVPNTIKISLDEKLEDRGKIFFSFGVPYEVLLGKTAFVSEGILASTLSHELEIHAKQKPKLFFWKFKKNLQEAEFEKEAYQHEINNQKRFNTSDSHAYACRYEREINQKVIDEINKAVKNSLLSFLLD